MAERPVAHRIPVTVASFRTWRVSQDRYCTGLDLRQSNVGGRTGQDKDVHVAPSLSSQSGSRPGSLIDNMEVMEFAGQAVEIKRKAYQKRLGVSVYPSGVIRVSANKTLSQREIGRFLEEQKDWIEKSLQDAHKLRLRHPPKTFKTGELYPYLGQDYRLEVLYGKRPQLRFHGEQLQFMAPIAEGEWTAPLRLKYFNSFKKAYRKVAAEIMAQRLEYYAQMMGLFPSGVQFRGQKTIWGSCSPENKISLNFKLIVAPIQVVDYVLIHELAHIRYKNHSKAFWNLVERYTPYRQFSRQWLREHQFKSDFLNKKSELSQ